MSNKASTSKASAKSECTFNSGNVREPSNKTAAKATPRTNFGNVPKLTQSPYVYTNRATEKSRNTIYDVKFCPYITTANYFATAAGHQLNLWEATSDGRLVMKHSFLDPNESEEFFCITWCMTSLEADKDLVVVFGGKTGAIRSMNPWKQSTTRNHLGHGDSVNDLATDPTRPFIFASASKDYTVRLWHAKQTTALAVLGGYAGAKDQVLSVDFHISGGYIASGSMDHTVRVWKIADNMDVQNAIKAAPYTEGDGNQPRVLTEVHYSTAVTKDLHANYVDCVKFLGNHIVSKSCEASLVVSKFGEFDDPSPCGIGNHNKEETLSQTIATLIIPEAYLWYIKFAMTNGPPTKAWIACGNQMGEVHLWDLHQQPFTVHSDFCLRDKELPTLIRVVDFNRSGTILLAAGGDGRITRFDRRIPEPETPPLRLSRAGKLPGKRGRFIRK
uniref:WD_REPEATS_REGION domain-containing protein n=1 Tax=Panagrellus redivivus TaxID=6233 RepID=A0A7E4V5S4_PANRE